MARLRSAAQLAKPVTGRIDRYLMAIVDEVRAAKEEILEEQRQAEARTAERYLDLSTRISAIERSVLNNTPER